MSVWVYLLILGLVSAQHQKVLLSSVKTLTLYANRQTNARRSSPIPQLVCVAGNACKYLTEEYISVMQCQNQGSDGIDVQWKCIAPDLPDWFRLGQTTVNCEGYEYPDDPYILAGSCGVEYKAYLTQRGKDHFQSYSTQSTTYSDYSQHSSFDFGFILLLAFFAYVFYLIFIKSSSHPPNNHSRPPPPSHTDDPPPPYDDGMGGSGGWFKYNTRPRATRSSTGIPGGFWSGLGLGGVLGYLGGRSTSQNRTYQDRSWFRSRPNMTYAPSGSSSATSFSTSETRDATGYGGTRRR